MRAFLLAVSIGLIFPALNAGQLSEKTTPLSIAHAAMRVFDLAKSREFYRRLGFEEAFVLEKDGTTTEVFIKVNDRQFIELYPREINSQAPGFMHVCFESSDVEGLNHIYKERGLSTTPVIRGSAGNLLFSVKFPGQQIIEFTEYLPGSMHSIDKGKHLGADRVSKHIAGVAMPVEDAAAALALYEDKLGFRRAPPSRGEAMLLPGASGEMIEMLPRAQASGFTLFFSVSDLSLAKSELRKAHFPVDTHDSSLTLTDPDANRVVFLKN